MKRSEFLKAIGLGATGLILPKSLLGKTPVKIYDNYVKGMQHYQYHEVNKLLSVGSELILKREEDNLHDAFAVEVYFEHYKLGYLPAYENIVIANMLDAKVELIAKISYFNPKSPIWKMETLGVEIFAELITPTSQLITELQNARANDIEDIYRQGYKF